MKTDKIFRSALWLEKLMFYSLQNEFYGRTSADERVLQSTIQIVFLLNDYGESGYSVNERCPK